MSFRLRVNKRSVIPSTFPTLQPFQKVGWNPGHPFYQANLILRVVEIHGISLSTVAGFLLNSLVWTSSYDQFTICSALRRPFRPMSLKHFTKPIPSISDIPYILAYFGDSFLYAISSGKNVGIDTHHPITNVEKSDGKPRFTPESLWAARAVRWTLPSARQVKAGTRPAGPEGANGMYFLLKMGIFHNPMLLYQRCFGKLQVPV